MNGREEEKSIKMRLYKVPQWGEYVTYSIICVTFPAQLYCTYPVVTNDLGPVYSQ